MFPGKVIYDDTNVEQMASIAPTQVHRNVDLEIVNADEAGKHEISFSSQNSI